MQSKKQYVVHRKVTEIQFTKDNALFSKNKNFSVI